jgi:Tol biopolymer transport system component
MYLVDMWSRGKKPKSQRLTMDDWLNYPSDWTRDSKSVLFFSLREGRRVILKQNIGAQTAEILISGEENYSWPVLSPAGDRLLFRTSPTSDALDPSMRLMLTSLDGGERLALLAGNYSYRCPSVPTASCVLAQVRGKQIVFSVLDLAKGRGAEIQRVDAAAHADWSLSPDGSKIAIGVPNLQDFRILILTIADHRVTLLPHNGHWLNVQHVTWAADGNHLFATAWSAGWDSQALLFIDPHGNLQTADETVVGTGWLENMRASPDGHYLAYTKRTYDGNVMMLEHF